MVAEEEWEESERILRGDYTDEEWRQILAYIEAKEAPDGNE